MAPCINRLAPNRTRLPNTGSFARLFEVGSVASWYLNWRVMRTNLNLKGSPPTYSRGLSSSMCSLAQVTQMCWKVYVNSCGH